MEWTTACTSGMTERKEERTDAVHAHGALLRACVWCLRMHMTCCCEDVLGACACARCAAVCIFPVLTHGVLLRVSSADVGKIVGQCSLRDTFLEVRKWIPGEGFCRAVAQFAACCGSQQAVSSLYNGCKCGVRHRGMRHVCSDCCTLALPVSTGWECTRFHDCAGLPSEWLWLSRRCLGSACECRPGACCGAIWSVLLVIRHVLEP